MKYKIIYDIICIHNKKKHLFFIRDNRFLQTLYFDKILVIIKVLSY